MAERMRVLLATDDSIAARVAEPWVTGGRWAKPPIVDVLSVAAPTVAAGPWLGRVRVGDAVGAIRELERAEHAQAEAVAEGCLLYTSPSPRDRTRSRMPSSA